MFSAIRRPGFLVIACAAGILTACLTVEVILRLTNTSQTDAQTNDPRTGLVMYRPHINLRSSSTCFDTTTQTDSAGLNADEFSPTKSSSTFRIVIVGGSFVEARQVSHQEAFSHQLEMLLNQSSHKKYTYEVIPFGFSGNGTYLDFLYYDKYIAQLKPDLLIDFATEYELTRDEPTTQLAPRFDAQSNAILDLPATSQDASVIFTKNLVKRSKLLTSLYLKELEVASSLHAFMAHPHAFGAAQAETSNSSVQETTSTETLWSTEEKLLSQFSHRVQTDGSKFVLATWFTEQIDETTKTTAAKRYLKMSQDAQLAYTDLTPTLSANESKSGQSPVWSCDDHWNVTGHAWAAQALDTYLEAHPELIGLTK